MSSGSASIAPHARWVPPNTRAAAVARAITEALSRHQLVLDSSLDIRSLQLDVKIKPDGTVRAVLVSFQGEVS